MRRSLTLIAAVVTFAARAAAAEVVPVPQFRSVELRGGGSVTVVPGPVQRVTIVDGSSQFTHMRVERDGQLRIDTCVDQCPPSYRLRVAIQSPGVPDLAISGGGIIVAEGGFRPQPRLAAAVNGGGQVLVRPRSSLSAAVNGGGHVRYLGSPQVTSAIHGGGSISPGL